MIPTIKDTFFKRASSDFNELALEVFRHQAEHCMPYRRFLDGLNVKASDIRSWMDIPHLPIEAFKNHQVQTGQFEPAITFTSSGTTGQVPSRHVVLDLDWYHRVFNEAFTWQYGSPSDYRWLCLLPSYLERKGSSLIEMASTFIQMSRYPESGFYLNNLEELHHQLNKANEDGRPTILLGVSFALLDLAEKHPLPLNPNIRIMETGGMKGRRKEMIRSELHEILEDAFNVNEVHSEYGMTELMSQAYSKGKGLYELPPWMRIKLRDPADPLSKVKEGKTGGMDIVDLANLDSCAFVATQDLGRLRTDTTFEVLGRFDDSDIRGCNLMVV